MTVIDVYHNVVGDQAKVWINTVKFGVLTVQMAYHDGRKKIMKKRAKQSLARRMPHQARVHISGVSHAIH